MRVIVVAAACATVMGCGTIQLVGEPVTWSHADVAGHSALRRAAVELDCAQWDELTVTSLGSGGYRVEGCGLTATYTCMHVHHWYTSSGTTCQRDGEIRSTAAPARVTAPAPTAPASASPSLAERTLRRVLEDDHDAILVCTSHHAVAVRVAWSIDGMTAVSLDGPVHATPTEGCVRHVLDGLRVPPSAHGGTLLQAVRPTR